MSGNRNERLVGELYDALRGRHVVSPLIERYPDLTDQMRIGQEIDIDATVLIAPRAEAEIAFVLKDGLNGSGITAADVIAATDYIAPCFEIVDSRIRDWKIGIVDTVADKASCGVFVLGETKADPRAHNLPDLHVTVTKYGAALSEGYGRAVQGDPARYWHVHGSVCIRNENGTGEGRDHRFGKYRHRPDDEDDQISSEHGIGCGRWDRS